MTDMRVIGAARLTLEPQLARHAAQMFTVLGDPAIYEHENEPPASVEWLEARFARLESRQSADGREQWLNWVVRLRGAGLIGYVQATVQADGHAAVAYVLSSAWWGRGLAREAVRAMIDELALQHGVHSLGAVLKRDNRRSLRLLQGLGFTPASPDDPAWRQVEPGELLMQRGIG